MQVAGPIGGAHAAGTAGRRSKIVIAERQQDIRSCSGAFTSFRANVPQLYVERRSRKAKKQDVPVTDVFETLQVYLGSLYVNDFNYLGRTYQVMAQADAPFRRRPRTSRSSRRAIAPGRWCRWARWWTIKDTTGPDRINRYNLYQSAEINGAPRPASAAGRRSRSMEQIAQAERSRRATSYEWTELALPGKRRRQHRAVHLPAVRAVRVPDALGASTKASRCPRRSS